MTARLAGALAALAVPAALPAQTVLRGTVVTAESKEPVSGALVTSAVEGRSVTTDQFGAFVITVSRLPDTLRVRMLGRGEGQLVVDSTPGPLLVTLPPVAVPIGGVMVTAPADAPAIELAGTGLWRIPLRLAREAPAAVETDVLRSLALVPAVTFSSPYSARPLFRGYASDQSAFRLDGFEVSNPYHLGRIFSGFAADAAQQVEVAGAPFAASQGGALGSVIDVAGRSGNRDRLEGGVDLSLASVTAWGGGGTGNVSGFIAGRTAHIAAAPLASESDLPYRFSDAYGTLVLHRGSQPVARVSAFAAHDVVREDATRALLMQWDNALVGARWTALQRRATTLELAASGTRFDGSAYDVPARDTRLDVHNRFERAGGAVTALVRQARWQLAAGVQPAWRAVRSAVTPLRYSAWFTPSDTRVERFELGAYADVTGSLGALSADAGVRVDYAGGTPAWQPRLRASIPLSAKATLSASAGRVAMLQQVVTDLAPEPEVVFYDFWLNAGTNGVPVPTVDHGVVALELTRGRVKARSTLYASWGRGLAELRPANDTAVSIYRFGRSRTYGTETQVSVATPRVGLLGGLTLARSERRWDGDWVRWRLDRQVLFRLASQVRVIGQMRAFVTFETSSGAPRTELLGVGVIGRPDPLGPGLVRDTFTSAPALLFGAENAEHGTATYHADLGIRWTFRGPARTTWDIGLSVMNLTAGPIAPVEPQSLNLAFNGRGSVRYERAYELPPIPTLTLRIER